MSYIQGPVGSVGTVTSVGLSLPNIFIVSGSPVVGAGTLTATFDTETANTVLAGPASGAAATPTFRALVAADVPASILPGTFSGFANPTASVGLTAVNGSATTAMRSDAAPALDQTAAYAFTGLGATVISQQGASASALTLTGGTVTTSQPLISSTQTWNAGAITFTGIDLNITNSASAAASMLANFRVGGTSKFMVDVSGVTNSVGGVGSAGNVTSGTSLSVTSNTGTVRLGASVDTILTRGGAAATWQLGAANAASPVAQTLQAQGSRPGTDVNTAGGGLTIHSGIGTGNVGTSTFTLQGIIGNATSTTTAQTVAAGISIPGVASGQLPGAVIGSAAIATNATDGFLYIASGAGPPTGTPTAFTGRVPLYYDSTNDQLYIFRASWKQPKTPAGAAIVTWQ